MKQESVKALADGATISAVSTGASSYFGWFTFINTNAPGIGVLLSLVFGTAGLIFYWLTWKKSTLAEKNKEKIDTHSDRLDDHIVETRDEFKKVGDGISLILNKLDKG